MILSVSEEGYSRNVPDEGYSRNVPDEGYSRNVPDEGYSRNVPDEGYSRIVPDEGYSRNIPDEGYSRNVPDEGYSSNVPDEGYSRNASCALRLISTFLLSKLDTLLLKQKKLPISDITGFFLRIRPRVKKKAVISNTADFLVSIVPYLLHVTES